VVAMSRAIPVRTWPGAREGRRRWIPALPTLWPGMLSPLASERRAAFPFGAERVTRYYFARNAVWHGARLLGLEGEEVLVPAYHHGVEVGALVHAGAVPRFVRVDGRMRLDLDDLEAKIGPRTRAIYVIHYAGFAQPDCAPWDGAAVWIVLTRGTAGARSDSLELWAYASVADVVGRRSIISPDPRSDGPSGAALYCAAGRPCAPVPAGSFVLDGLDAGGPLVGHFDLELAGAGARVDRVQHGGHA